MSKTGDDLFASYQKYKAKMVDSPSYEPLGQRVIVTSLSDEEKKKEKAREYQKKYYQEHKEKYREYASRSWRKYHPKKGDRGLMGMQLAIYNYLVEKIQEGEEAPRGTQIARDLGITCAQVYNAVFVLIKKGYVGRWASGRYFLPNIPEKKKEITVSDLDKTYKKLYNKSPEEVHLEGAKVYGPQDYEVVDELKKQKEKNEELKNELEEYKKKNEELEEQVKNSISHIEGLMESNDTLEKKNSSLRGEIEELKGVVKVLLKYFQ